jgi:hypothetical protein
VQREAAGERDDAEGGAERREEPHLIGIDPPAGSGESPIGCPA